MSNSVTTTEQTKDLVIQLLALLSAVMQSVNNDYSALVSNIRDVPDGVEFLNGNGDVVHKIYVME